MEFLFIIFVLYVLAKIFGASGSEIPPKPQNRTTVRPLVPVTDTAQASTRAEPLGLAKPAAVNPQGGQIQPPPPRGLGTWQAKLGGAARIERPISRSDELAAYLKAKGQTKLYHFTDRSNIKSIISNGGLYSWAYCANCGIGIPRPGGNDLSRELDQRRELGDYVRLSFVRDHPMMYAARAEDRIQDPVILEVELDAVRFRDVLFADRNATAKGAHVAAGLDGLEKVRLDLIRRGRWTTDEEKTLLQAEVLVRSVVPGYLIRYEGRLIREKTATEREYDYSQMH